METVYSSSMHNAYHSSMLSIQTGKICSLLSPSRGAGTRTSCTPSGFDYLQYRKALRLHHNGLLQYAFMFHNIAGLVRTREFILSLYSEANHVNTEL